MERYKIGDYIFCWNGKGYKLEEGRFFKEFRYNLEDGIGAEYISFEAEFEELEKYESYPRIIENYFYEVYEIDGKKLIVYHWDMCRFGFAIWTDDISAYGVNKCYINPKMRDILPMNQDWFFGFTGLNQVLLKREAPILHGSYIDYKGKGILFCAPSQTGKSTQAKLWEEHTGAEIINGDRVLLRKKDDKWYAYGYPCCGSSDICHNRTLPIRAIVILRQGDENRIERMSVSDKIRSIASGIEVFKWDLESIDIALKMSESIASEVTVIKYYCKPDAEAVNILKKFLEEET